MQRILPPKERTAKKKRAEERYGAIGERSQERDIGMVKPLQNPRARYQ